MSDTKDQVQGKAEEMKGHMTGNDKDTMKGKAEQAWSDVENKADEAKQKVSNNT